MMCQCRFIDYNKGTTTVQDADNGGGCVYAVAKGLWEVSCAQYCCEPKTALKNEIYFFKKAHITLSIHYILSPYTTLIFSWTFNKIV